MEAFRAEVNKLSMEDDTLERQMEWCIDQDVDVILWPCTQTAWAIIVIKHLLGDKGKHIMIFACIETTVGFDNLDSILEKADGIYVDRTVLSLDMPIEKIFIAQKEIISKCNKLGKPVICKTSINEQMPTLCVTDLANLILDGADCIALQIEWELGMTRQLSQVKNPTKAAENCLSAASVICRQAENIVWQPKVYGNVDFMQMELEDGSKAVAISSVELSIRCRAVAIICLTNSGRTARLISRAKPLCPIVAVTRICQVARQLRLYRGTRPLHYIERPHPDWTREVEKRIQAGLSYCKMKGFCRSGDAYVAVSGHRRGSGYTNTVQVFYASGRDVVPVDFD